MNMKIVDLKLPEWAFLDAHSHLGDELGSRTIILHIRSASVIEIFNKNIDNPILEKKIITYEFSNYIGESLVAALHYCATLDGEKDREMILEKILIPCSKFFSDYTKWEDTNILNEETSKLN